MNESPPPCMKCGQPATLVRMHPKRPKYACRLDHMPDAENPKNKPKYRIPIIMDVEAGQQLVCENCLQVVSMLHARFFESSRGVKGICTTCNQNIR